MVLVAGPRRPDPPREGQGDQPLRGRLLAQALRLGDFRRAAGKAEIELT